MIVDFQRPGMASQVGWSSWLSHTFFSLSCLVFFSICCHIVPARYRGISGKTTHSCLLWFLLLCYFAWIACLAPELSSSIPEPAPPLSSMATLPSGLLHLSLETNTSVDPPMSPLTCPSISAFYLPVLPLSCTTCHATHLSYYELSIHLNHSVNSFRPSPWFWVHKWPPNHTNCHENRQHLLVQQYMWNNNNDCTQ